MEHIQLEDAAETKREKRRGGWPAAPRGERLRLYGPLYDELFRRVPNHPQLTRKVSEAERRAASDDKFSLLARFIDQDTVFLEIGAGDCAFTLAVADRGARKCSCSDRFVDQDTVFLEIGAGDCAFTLAVADRGAASATRSTSPARS